MHKSDCNNVCTTTHTVATWKTSELFSSVAQGGVNHVIGKIPLTQLEGGPHIVCSIHFVSL